MTVAEVGATLANVSRVGSNAGLVLRALENRAALAMLELEEARRRLEATVVWSMIALVALLLAGITTTVLVAAIFWETPQRVVALVILAVVELAAAATGVRFVVLRWHRWVPLAHTRDQLVKDSSCLREILTPNNS